MDFYKRLLAEKEELDSKIEKLEQFYNSTKINSIDEAQKDLLGIQLPAMKTYRTILSVRIKLIGD
jgi:TPP-dependent indolepyruvate ferredoxin oxidoreductase alpha subunit